MDNERLKEILRPLASAVAPRKTLRAQRNATEAFRDDGTLEESILTKALPWQRADVSIPGSAVAMSGAARVAFPQGGVIRHVSIFARTTPSSTYQITIQAGSESQSFSLQSGQSVSMAPASIAVPGGVWAHINVTNTGGAADIIVVLHYSAAGTSSGGSGGGSGGSGGGGAGAVLSVNGQTGTVLLNADHIDDTSTSHKFATAAQLTKLNGINMSNYVLASSLALVATSGNYNDLSGRPTLGTAAAMNANSFASAAQGAKADTAVQPADLAGVATSGDYADLNDKPTIPAQFNPIAGTNVNITGTYPDITFSASGGGGGGGAVDSVNGQTGAVVLDADDIDDASTTHKFATASQLTKLEGIEAGAEINVQSDWNAANGDAHILNKPTVYTQAQVDALLDSKQVVQGATASNTVRNTNYVGTVFASFEELYSGTLSAILPEISAGTWDVTATASALVYRSIATGGVYFGVDIDGDNTMVLGRNFPQTGGYTLSVSRTWRDVVPGDLVEIKFGGFSTPGATNCVSHTASFFATRTG